MTALIVLTVIVLLLVAAVLCAIEVAFLYASRARLYQMNREGDRRAGTVLDLMQHPDLLLATLVLGLNTITILSSALTTMVLVNLFGDAGVVYATLIMAVAVFLFSEALPKSLGTRYPEAIALKFARPVRALYRFCLPLTLLVRAFNGGILRLLGLPATKTPAFTEGDLRGAISMGLEHGTIHKTEFRMLDAVLNLDTLTVADVMVHASAIVGVDVATSPAQLPKLLGTLNHTHLPVYEGRPDNFIGILAIRDYLNALGQVAKRSEVDIRKIIRPLYTVPATTPLGAQLFEFSKNKLRHMALVTGGDKIIGLLTIEDILEEITNPAVQEAASPAVTQKPATDGSVTLPGLCAVIDVNKAFGWDLPVDEAVTLAGLVVEEAGRLPAQGESLTIGAYQVTVVYKRGHLIETVKIIPRK